VGRGELEENENTRQKRRKIEESRKKKIKESQESNDIKSTKLDDRNYSK
jgi:hypothetical protein